MAQTSTALVLYQPYPNKNLAEYIRAVQESHDAYTAQLSPTGQLPALMALPVELFMQIYELLTVESQAMLAVTCKSLYRSMFPRVAIKQVKHRGGMLRCIERQMPQQYYCPVCVRLHRVSKQRITPRLPIVPLPLLLLTTNKKPPPSPVAPGRRRQTSLPHLRRHDP